MSALLTQGQPTGDAIIELSPEGFARLFPFHFACDGTLVLTQTGASLQRLSPELRPGRALATVFEFMRPTGELSPERLVGLEGTLVVLRHLATGIMMRGQFLATSGQAGWVFLGGPWLVNGEDFEASGLSLDDFPPHDPITELLMFNQTQQIAMQDLQVLNERLERKRQQVAWTEALYRAAISAADAVPYREDFASDAFSYAGEGFAALTGYEPGEISPSRLRDEIAPARRTTPGVHAEVASEADELTRRMTGGAALHQRREYPFRTRVGELRWLSDASVLVTDEAGTVVGAIGMLQDVTARRNARDKLRRSEAEARRLAIVTSRTSSAVVITDAGREIEWVNEAFTAMTGYTREEALGRRMRDMLRPEQADPAMGQQALAAIARGESFHGEIALQRKDGGELWVAAEMKPMFDSHGKLEGYTAVATDITTIKTYERRLEDLSAELGSILSVIPGGVVAIDGSGRLAYCNEAFSAMFGRSADELRGMPAVDLDALLHAACAPGERPIPLLDLADGQGDVLRLAQPVRVLARTVRFIRGHDVATRWRAFYLHDITQQVEVDRMKSEFLSTAAHELRTPMSSVHGFAELLVSRDFDADTARTIARTIHRQSSLLVQMVNELLDLARMEAGQGRDFTFEVQALAPIVRETADALLMPGDPRRAEFAPADGDSLRVNVDADKLRLAVTNVLSNAFKYSRGRGRVLVSLPTRERHGRVEVGIRVRDSGVGMTPEQLRHVFERFYRADPAGAVSGTGLGMTLVKEIIEAMQGSVEIESVAGSGTTVTLWLPSAGV